ncbi:MAG: hypothetical protein ACO2PK_12120 [Armatimonadota bacterium]
MAALRRLEGMSDLPNRRGWLAPCRPTKIAILLGRLFCCDKVLAATISGKQARWQSDAVRLRHPIA